MVRLHSLTSASGQRSCPSRSEGPPGPASASRGDLVPRPRASLPEGGSSLQLAGPSGLGRLCHAIPTKAKQEAFRGRGKCFEQNGCTGSGDAAAASFSSPCCLLPPSSPPAQVQPLGLAWTPMAAPKRDPSSGSSVKARLMTSGDRYLSNVFRPVWLEGQGARK